MTPSGYAPTFITAASHDAHFAVNSRAVALMMAEFARRLIEQGKHWGRIINISTDGSAGFMREVSYGASKFALESYSRAAASGYPEDVADVVVFLASEQARWLTGQLLFVGGGHRMV